jgi:hypothetical protein
MVDAACDVTGVPSNRKSSVASTEVPDGNDDALTMAPLRRYPVDEITESTPCELHVQVLNLTMKVAVGYAVPMGPTPTYHFSPVPNGYAIVGVDEVMPQFEGLKLHHPAGEDGEVLELGDAKKATILWPKEFIVLPNWVPRPSTPQSSNPSSPADHDPAQSSPPPRQPSPPPRQQHTTSGSTRGKRSPKRKLSPLPTVPHKNLPREEAARAKVPRHPRRKSRRLQNAEES